MLTDDMEWLVPSFYGDLRLEAVGAKQCRLIVEQATVAEAEALAKLQAHAAKRGWCDHEAVLGEGAGSLLSAPIQKVARVLAKVLKPGRETVSAIRIAGGRIEEVTRSTFDEGSVATASEGGGGPFREAMKPTVVPPKEPEKKPEPQKVVATTVAAPQLGCPPPDFPPAELRATRVLNAFLDDGQREDFARHNRFVTVGGTTGHRYMVTSRHARGALLTYQRSLYDLDENLPICTHDHDVPAAEELLALHLLVSLPGREEHLRSLSPDEIMGVLV